MSLRVKCEQYEDKIRKLDEERASLLLVINLVAREANETNCGDQPNSNVVDAKFQRLLYLHHFGEKWNLVFPMSPFTVNARARKCS